MNIANFNHLINGKIESCLQFILLILRPNCLSNQYLHTYLNNNIVNPIPKHYKIYGKKFMKVMINLSIIILY